MMESLLLANHDMLQENPHQSEEISHAYPQL